MKARAKKVTKTAKKSRAKKVVKKKKSGLVAEAQEKYETKRRQR